MNYQLAKLIEDLEVSLLLPEVRNSAKRINELLADDFVELGMFGKIYSKQDFIELLPNSDAEKATRYKASDFNAREIARNTVLLTYKASCEFPGTYEAVWTLRCSIWQKRGENWQMIFHQGTVTKGVENKNS